MELRIPHMLHLFNVFHENKDSDNCAKVLEEECIRMFGTKSLNDENDCNVVSMNSLNIHDANDMQGKSNHHSFWTRYDHETICIGDLNDHVHCKVHKYGKEILNFQHKHLASLATI